MKVKMFAVYDSKAEAYLQPFFMQSTGVALRAWETTVNDEKTEFSKYPGDYTLFEIAEYDDATGNVLMLNTKINLGTALEYKERNMQRSLHALTNSIAKPSEVKESLQ